METYYIATRVRPLPDNPLIDKVEDAQVYFWIVDDTPEKAGARATRYLASYKWKLQSIESGPVATTAADFAEEEQGLKGFWKAKQKGFAAHFVARPKQPPLDA